MLAPLSRFFLPLIALGTIALPAQGVTPKVVSGGYHTLLLRADGTTWAWGENTNGQIGDGSLTSALRPKRIAGLADVVDISATWRHSVAVKRNGTVWAWGDNVAGALGDGTLTDRYQPTLIPDFQGVTKVATGWAHSLAIKGDGTVWAWGLNSLGQIGDGSGVDRWSPVQIPGLTNMVAISGGNSHSLALKSDGTVWAWGYNEYGQLGDGGTANHNSPVQVIGLANVVAIAASAHYSLAVLGDGTVMGWGWRGGLNPDASGAVSAPTAIPGLTSVATVMAGGYHNLALKRNGSITPWGDLYAGAGNVWNFSGAVAVAAGDSFSVVIDGDGGVWSMGLNRTTGSLGDGSTVSRPNPVPILAGPSGYIAVANGGSHSVVLSADGKVFGWGAANGSSIAPRALVAGVTGVDLLAAGELFSLARKTDGTVLAWGANQFCQLGKGGDTSYSLGAVSGLTNVSALAGGYAHGLAVKTDGTVWGWGTNGYGQLGDGTTAMQCSPVQVAGLTSATQAAAGWSHSIARRSDGTVWSWGHNAYGQLGDGTTVSRETPAAVPAFGFWSVRSVAAGAYHNLALMYDGTVQAWGTNANGELGDGTTTQRNAPVQVAGLTDVVAVAAGYRHSLALKSDGSVWAWGGNPQGQLGIGSHTNQLTPVQVVGLTDIRSIASGPASTQSVALRSDGAIFVWGSNAQSTLGDGTYQSDRTTPVPLDDVFTDSVPANWLPTAGALSTWTVSADIPYAGPNALKSGMAGTSAQSGIQVSGNFRDGFATFQRKVSSEPNADYLRFYVDGVKQGEWSGEQGWARAGIFLRAGTHTLAWKYEKNGSVSVGSDAAWIDSVELPTAFADVASSSWAFEYVNALKDAGITTGCGTPGNYCPSQNVTREQMAAFIIRAVEGEPATCAAAPFPDVPTSNAFCKYIKRMLDLNITTGCGGGNYCPSQNVTRDQMAAFIIRAVEGNPLAGYCGSTSPFSDVPTSSGFCGHIKRMLELNITTGCGNGNYCPTQAVTRDQMAAFLSRAFLGM